MLSLRGSYYWILAAVFCLGWMDPGAEAAREEINWFIRVEDAQAAAAKSGKPVYMYIFSPPQKACRRMRSETLMHPAVIAQLRKHFECCAVDSTEQTNKAWVDRYAWGVARANVEDPEYNKQYTAKIGSMPAHVFADAKGEAYFTFWGYMPPQAFLVKLGHINQIVRSKTAIDKDDTDARAHADLGHALLELEDFKNSKVHLEKARGLDPSNKVGALETASLYLTVLSIVDDPVKSSQALSQFLRDYPRSKRLMEARYWRAVALYAQQTKPALRQALEALKPFRQIDPKSPEYTSKWAVLADKLEKHVRIDLGLERMPASTRQPTVHR